MARVWELQTPGCLRRVTDSHSVSPRRIPDCAAFVGELTLVLLAIKLPWTAHHVGLALQPSSGRYRALWAPPRGRLHDKGGGERERAGRSLMRHVET
eukprot:30282-Prymnesium_polylepis.1